MPTPIIETERLILTPRCEEENAQLQLYFNDWDIIKQMSAGDTRMWPCPPDSVQRLWDIVLKQGMEEDRWHGWSLRLKSDPDHAFGQIVLIPEDQEDERGFWIGRPYWGKGYANEAKIAMTKFWFEALHKPSLTVKCRADNSGSNRIQEKQGFEVIKTMNEPYADGETHQTNIWRVSKENFYEAIK